MSKLKHHFKHICYDKDFLFDGTLTIKQFMDKLRKQSYEKPNNFDPDTYYGRGFEILIESLIKQQGRTKKLMICKYKPIKQNKDYGVDGIGIGHKGVPHAVQIKARQNTKATLTPNKDMLSNFVAHAKSKYADENGKIHLTIFTTAMNLHHVCEEMYGDNINVIHNNYLKKLIDGNDLFWEKFYKKMI